jgi:1,2-diacylglycerol 3-beta-galactosyltransferase
MAGMTSTSVLFLVADTGGGHRGAARAIAEALQREHPGRFAPTLLDPLGGPGSPRILRRVTGLYGPVVRHAPALWGLAYRATDSRPATALLHRTLLRAADRPVRDAARRLRPAVIVSCHPLTTEAAVRASRGMRVPVVTVVTDLAAVHAAWPHYFSERIVVASSAARLGCARRGVGADRCAELGLPVSAAFGSASAALGKRSSRPDGPFRVVVTGGGEGAGGIARRVSALVRRFDDIEVVALCGRNRRARAELETLAAGSAGRLTVCGLLDGIADWLRSADVVVTKAGPGTIAEAACCGAAILLSSRLPGQEDGNAELVAAAGAGRYVPRVSDLLREVSRLRADPAALAAMRAASARLARPRAAADIAALIAGILR